MAQQKSESPIITLDLVSLPQFNVTYISQCLTISERLSIMTRIHKRLHDFIYTPQCFPDMSFSHFSDHQMYTPKILSSNGKQGITYVQLNIFSQHPFVQKVALLAGMWNIDAYLWNHIAWPRSIHIESLQLTLNPLNSASTAVHLDYPPGIVDNKTLANNYETRCRLRNLFFVLFDRDNSTCAQPEIYLPKTLCGLGLQSFTSRIFSQDCWIQQIQFEKRLESLRFLVLSCCDFTENQLQILLQNIENIEHLSLRYVQWDGIIMLPKSLLSLGYFPNRHVRGYYSLKHCTKLWQVATRLSENEQASIEFLNRCSTIESIKRVKFEFIIKERYFGKQIELENLLKWEERNTDNEQLTVAISDEDLNYYPILKEIMSIPSSNFLTLGQVKFEDCPLWSDDAYDFLQMTKKRKLLVR